jgi:hypothetical protein
MNASPENNGERFAEFTLPEGCLSCGGEVSIRATPAGARGYCPQCHWLSKPQVRVRPNGLEISYSTVGQA